ncbi:allatostatin-A receptor-like isoform X2 [Portunus trituberculatus]|uniref:allatostatin-A receptor-like isoform X2 n=1 Tax=Portunus trituberculatus TaxID=210409 RepID=UPI001E1CF5C3|nr:allatostatin-A receptor-like isoform X2 [Portunus trituberculatus]
MSPSVPFTEMVHASYIGPTLEDNMSFFGPMDLTTPGVIEILGNASQPTLERNMSAVDRNSGWMALTRVAEELNCKDYLDNNTTFERNCMPLDDPMEMRKPHKANPSFMPIVVTHALTFLLGVSGNSVIVFSMAKDKGTRNVTSWFLVSLAVADLLLLLLCVPLETVQYFLWAPHLTLPICKLSSYFELLSAVASVLNLTAVSLERYLVIVYPMRSRSFCTLSNCRRAIVLVWCISLVLSLPAGYAQDVYSMTYFNATHNVTVYHCATGGELDLIFAVYRLIIVFLLPALFMSFFYARVIKALWVSTRTMSAMTRVYSISSHHSLASCSVTSGLVRSQSSPSVASGLAAFHSYCSVRRCVHRQRSGEEVKQARKQVIKMLILVIILFMACWGPKIVFFVFQKNGFSQESFKPLVYNMRICLGLLPFIHSCLNPIIYSFMSTNFGRMVRRTCARENCSTILNNLCLGAAKYRPRTEDHEVDNTPGVLMVAPPSEPLYLENGVGYDLANTSFLDLNGHTPSITTNTRPGGEEN